MDEAIGTVMIGATIDAFSFCRRPFRPITDFEDQLSHYCLSSGHPAQSAR
jgi:hypothetical protein